MLEHPWKLLAEYLEKAWRTQKAFSQKIGKKGSEINELIKGKRNITIAWDLLFAEVFGTSHKFWISKQIDYDYQQALIAQEKRLDNFDDQHSSFSEMLSVEELSKQEVMSEEKHLTPSIPEEFAITKVFETF